MVLARDAFVGANRHAIVMVFVRLFVRVFGTLTPKHYTSSSERQKQQQKTTLAY